MYNIYIHIKKSLPNACTKMLNLESLGFRGLIDNIYSTLMKPKYRTFKHKEFTAVGSKD